MAEYRAGLLEYRGRSYPFNDSHIEWFSGGSLHLNASGDRCRLSLIGVPFPGVSEIGELPGKVWEPDEDDLSFYADTFAEGGLEVRKRRLEILGCRVECRRFDPGRGILIVSFRLEVQDDEDARQDEVEGVAYCRVRIGDETSDLL